MTRNRDSQYPVDCFSGGILRAIESSLPQPSKLIVHGVRRRRSARAEIKGVEGPYKEAIKNIDSADLKNHKAARLTVRRG